METAEIATSARIENLVSAVAYARFPGLLESIEKWVDLAGAEGSDLLISAVPIDCDWVSVRVTTLDTDGVDLDWLEWLAPSAYIGADPAALDHYVARNLQVAMDHLRTRAVTGKTAKVLPSTLVDPKLDLLVKDLVTLSTVPEAPKRRSAKMAKASEPKNPEPKPATKQKAQSAATSPATTPSTNGRSRPKTPASAPVPVPASAANRPKQRTRVVKPADAAAAPAPTPNKGRSKK